MRSAAMLVLTLGLFAAALPATVTIEPGTKFQTIEGLGCAVAEWLYDPNNTQTAMNLMVQDLGATFLRLYPEPDFEPSAGQFRPTAPNTAAQFSLVQKAATAGLDRVVLSTFTPPAWMKTSNSLIGGHLSADKYDEYAEYYSRYVQAMNAAAGRSVVYGVSPENEPEWEQWYISCVFTPTEMRDAIKAIGTRLDADGLTPRIFGAETLVSARWGEYYGITVQDTTARRLLDVLAVHAYENNGVSASSPSAVIWRRIRDAAKTHGKTAWMTETSGYDASFDAGLIYANGLYVALKYGELSGWVFLNFNTRTGANEQEALCVNGTPKKIFYTSKNYYRWVRPGAIQVGAVSSDSSVLAIAFVHPANQTMTVILTNNGSSQATATLSGSTLPSFTAFRTSASENCAQVSSVSGSNVTLPAKSITTLYGTGYVTAVREPLRSAARVSRAAVPAGAELFSLNGRRVTAVNRSDMANPRATATGVFCARAADGSGATVPVVR